MGVAFLQPQRSLRPPTTMMRRRVLSFVGAVGLLVGTFLSQSCGSDDDDDSTPKKDSGTGGQAGASGGTAGGGTGGGVDVKPNCELTGTSCANNGDCCSAFCDPALQACANPPGQCKVAGESCSVSTECCTLVCDGGSCGTDICVSDNQACTSNAECCGGKCSSTDAGAGVCTPLSGSCKTAGNTCSTNTDCCSHLCSNGNCSAKPSFCSQTGDVCGADTECCTGICGKASGATLGLCKPASAPGTTGCLIAGEVCSGGAVITDAGIPACGGECCSRACAPYGPTGVLVCQPPSGCHPTGEVCVDDSDCCGAPGVPGGNGSGMCSKAAGEPTGRCDNGNACRPAGAVCKLATSSCNAENNCCAGNVNIDPSVCQQDLLGIPRCTGVGDCDDAGSKAGEPCASSADCCGLPCLPNDAAGDGDSPFICGGSSCVPANGACTTDADCCSGIPCIAAPGSTKGTCGPGQPDSGTDSGPGCALYGQDCSTNSDCCNGVPCTLGNCVFPIK